MFVVDVEYIRPLEDVDKFLQAHRAFLDEYYAKGVVITSGPQTPRRGGVIMLKAASRDEALDILSHDPFKINGIADYHLIEFTPTKFSDSALSQYLI